MYADRVSAKPLYSRPSLPLFCLVVPRPPTFTLFPYTTLFRSLHRSLAHQISLVQNNDVPMHDLRHGGDRARSEEHTSELQSHSDLVCRLLLEKKKNLCRNRGTPSRYDRSSSATTMTSPYPRWS